jgi:hypothetical protein
MAGKGGRYRPVDENKYAEAYDQIDWDGPRTTREQSEVVERVRVFKNNAKLWIADKIRRMLK